MTALPEHPVSSRLALLALCGDLVVAIDAMSIREIRRVAETTVRSVSRRMSTLQLDGELVPGWDLGELLGIEMSPTAWVIVDLPGVHGRAGLRVGRCVMVQALPVCRAIPHAIFASRPQAIVAAFSAAAIPELTDHVSGVVIDLSRLLGDSELAAMAKLGKEGREAILEV
jgi:chemotaxis signal transduction protein